MKDLVTRLVWQRDPGEKVTWAEALAGARLCRVGGHADWRLPTIKELYSLILFSGLDVDPRSASSGDGVPFIDKRVFTFAYGDPAKGERVIDSQWTTSTRYVHTTMGGTPTVFGVNFADGRIKGYGLKSPPGRFEKTFYVRYVRGNPAYGTNDLVDEEDGTITDRATGLTWMKQDSGHLEAGPRGDGRMTWEEALAWAEGLEHAGHADWRLPNAKELQSLVDYTRSPDTTRSAAIDPVFDVSVVENEAGAKDYPFYWTGTTHASARGGSAAIYVAFGRSLGWMRPPGQQGEGRWLDVHGAGSQRSDPKAGDPDAFPRGRGPQGDAIRILNHVRCVRGGVASPRTKGPALRPVARRPERPEGPGGEAGRRPGPRGPGGRGFVERLDRDGDGRVSKDEFDGPEEHFGHFDRNGDGYIDADEAPTGPPPGRSPGGPPGPPGGRGR